VIPSLTWASERDRPQRRHSIFFRFLRGIEAWRTEANVVWSWSRRSILWRGKAFALRSTGRISCDTPLHEQTPSLLTLPTSRCKRTRAHSLPWLSLPSCLPHPLCLRNPNFEILKRCIIVPLHISSPPLHRVFCLLNASKILILRFWTYVLLIYFIFHLFYLSYFVFPISLLYTFYFVFFNKDV